MLTRLGGGKTPMPPGEEVREFARHGTTMAVFLSAARQRAAGAGAAGGRLSDVHAGRRRLPGDLAGGAGRACTIGTLEETVKEHRLWKHTLFLVGPALDAHGTRSHLYHPGHFHGFRKADPAGAPRAARAGREHMITVVGTRDGTGTGTAAGRRSTAGAGGGGAGRGRAAASGRRADCRRGAERVVLGPLAPALDTIGTYVAEERPGGGAGLRRPRVLRDRAGAGRAVRARSGWTCGPVSRPSRPRSRGSGCRGTTRWSSARTGGTLRTAVNVCRAHPKVAVLTGPGAGPAELGAALRGPAAARAGRRVARWAPPEERVERVTPAEAAGAGLGTAVSVVLCLDEDGRSAPVADGRGRRRAAGRLGAARGRRSSTATR